MTVTTDKMAFRALAFLLSIAPGSVLFAAETNLLKGAEGRPLSSFQVLNDARAVGNGGQKVTLSSSEVLTILDKESSARPAPSGGGVLEAPAADDMLVVRGKKITRVELVMRLHRYVTPTESEVRQLFDFVVGSPHVRENAMYDNIMKNVKFVYSNDVDIVNSYANMAPTICVLGGDARFSRLVGLAVAACKVDKDAAVRFVRALTPRTCARMDEATSLELMKKTDILHALLDDEVLMRARCVAAGYLLFTIAHESGHLSMAHVLSPDYTEKPLEISRNQEREADSFASSVIASSPFGEYMFTGRLFELYAHACCEKGRHETTHPLSVERLRNLIRENPALAASFGISADSFKDGDLK